MTDFERLDKMLDRIRKAPSPDWYGRAILGVAIAMMFVLCIATLATSMWINRQLIATTTTQTNYESRASLNEAAIQALQEANAKLEEQGKAPLPIPDASQPLNSADLTDAAAQLVISELPTIQNGVNGIDGVAGPQGPQGPSGPPGEPGPSGSPGEPGSSGAAGQPGAPGTSGTSGLNGLDGANGADGANGVSVIDISLSGCDLVFSLSSGQSVVVGNVCGPQGEPGAQGPAGEPGPQGPQGNKAKPVRKASRVQQENRDLLARPVSP